MEMKVILLLISLGLLYYGAEGDLMNGGGMVGGMAISQFGGMGMAPNLGNGFGPINSQVDYGYQDLIGNLNDGPSDPKDEPGDLSDLPDIGDITGIDCIDNFIKQVISWFVKLADLPSDDDLKKR